MTWWGVLGDWQEIKVVGVGYTEAGKTAHLFCCSTLLLSFTFSPLSFPFYIPSLLWSGNLCSPFLGAVIYDRFQSIQEAGQHWNPSIPIKTCTTINDLTNIPRNS
jgi:hypothetical protein